MKNKIIHLIFLFCSLMIASCKKDTIYEVDDVTVAQPGGEKTNVKSTVEFISIAYSDLFNTTIPNDSLLYIQQAYEGFGDKKLIEDRIIRHFLNSPFVQLPTSQQMRADIPGFLNSLFNKFLNRTPNEFEIYFLGNIIRSDTTITPALAYYAALTSDEYRYY